jgi:CubicO group peptidase (beta-lactamase class C family)
VILARLLPCAFAVLLVAQSPLNATPKHHAAKDHETKDNPVLELTPDTVITRVKYAPDKPPLELTLQQFIKKYNIPGISVAVIDNYKVVWAKGFGVAVAGGTEPVTTTTLFQAGSISKPVATAGALWLVEHGKLSLDEDVNKKLKTWKVPENQFTATEKVTLRRLMTHTAGLTVHGFPGYAVGEPLPRLVQIFNGEKPANTEAIRVDFVPGSKRRYSGGGVTIEQQLMIDVTGQPFPEIHAEDRAQQDWHEPQHL